jgi:hypothetical protein
MSVRVFVMGYRGSAYWTGPATEVYLLLPLDEDENRRKVALIKRVLEGVISISKSSTIRKGWKMK